MLFVHCPTVSGYIFLPVTYVFVWHSTRLYLHLTLFPWQAQKPSHQDKGATDDKDDKDFDDDYDDNDDEHIMMVHHIPSFNKCLVIKYGVACNTLFEYRFLLFLVILKMVF